jgi:hypothetical protein
MKALRPALPGEPEARELRDMPKANSQPLRSLPENLMLRPAIGRSDYQPQP